jgi:hypothetical protein
VRPESARALGVGHAMRCSRVRAWPRIRALARLRRKGAARRGRTAGACGAAAAGLRGRRSARVPLRCAASPYLGPARAGALRDLPLGARGAGRHVPAGIGRWTLRCRADRTDAAPGTAWTAVLLQLVQQAHRRRPRHRRGSLSGSARVSRVVLHRRARERNERQHGRYAVLGLSGRDSTAGGGVLLGTAGRAPRPKADGRATKVSGSAVLLRLVLARTAGKLSRAWKVGQWRLWGWTRALEARRRCGCGARAPRVAIRRGYSRRGVGVPRGRAHRRGARHSRARPRR